MTTKKLNKRFEDMLKLSVQPFQPTEGKQEKQKDDDYISKKIRQRKSVNTSGKQRDTSR